MNEDVQKTKRVMTSAIHSLRVADVRKALGFIRKRWAERNANAPFYPSETLDPIIPNTSIEEFALQFVLGHHIKRAQKSRQAHARLNVNLNLSTESDVDMTSENEEEYN